MFCNKKTIKLEKKDDQIHIRPLGDIHIGNVGCDIEKLQESITRIAEDPLTYTIGMGDYIDNVQPYRQGMVDKRYNIQTVDRKFITTTEQIQEIVKFWEPIKHKTIGLHAGNHEWSTLDQVDFADRVCKPLGLPYLGRLAYTCLTFEYRGKPIRDYLILSMHGGFSSDKKGGAVNRLEDVVGSYDCDVALMGHNHDSFVTPLLRLGYDKETNQPTERKILIGNTGTFLRGHVVGYDMYPEINPKRIKRVGTITITFSPHDGGIYGHD